jgi:hypothetical protein
MCCLWLLAGCGNHPPAVLSVGDLLRIGTAQPQRVAGVLIWGDDQQLTMVASIALFPDTPVQVAVETLHIESGTIVLQMLPWRDTGDLRYLPAIVTVHTDPISQRPTLTTITFDIGEYHLSHLPTDRVVRITGRFVRRDGQQFLVARESAAQFIALQPSALTEFLPSRSDILVEGVAVQSVFIPLVIAPITTHP